jgi:hypothetical protein
MSSPIKSALLAPSSLFAAAVGVILVAAFFEGLTYPLRASILILFTTGIGTLLVLLELFNEARKAVQAAKINGQEGTPETGPENSAEIYDTPKFADYRDASEKRRAMIDIWGWYLGLLVAVLVIGFHVAVPLFAIVYGRTHGGSWKGGIIMALIMLAVIMGLFTWMMNVPWPTPLLLEPFL